MHSSSFDQQAVDRGILRPGVTGAVTGSATRVCILSSCFCGDRDHDHGAGTGHGCEVGISGACGIERRASEQDARQSAARNRGPAGGRHLGSRPEPEGCGGDPGGVGGRMPCNAGQKRHSRWSSSMSTSQQLDGIALCRRLRCVTDDPILLLTPKRDEAHLARSLPGRCRRVHRQAGQPAGVGGQGAGLAAQRSFDPGRGSARRYLVTDASLQIELIA